MDALKADAGYYSDLHDSGYTEAELDALFAELTQGVTFAFDEEAMMLALAIGISAGDVVMLSESGTVMLPGTRAELDANVAAVRAALAKGKPLREATAKLP